MSATDKLRHILVELKGHAPFTIVGAIVGIAFMFVFRNMGYGGSSILFAVFHPAHVLLSAMVTSSMFGLHVMRKRFLLVLVIGYFGSVGLATIGDVVIPHIGANLLGLDIPPHNEMAHADEGPEIHDEEAHGMHFGFIEEWYIVNPAALLGVLIAYFIPRTKFPHAGHVLISTWASSSYLLMNLQSSITAGLVAGMFITLFIAVWLPCCVSDIIFPLLFVKSDIEIQGTCSVHDHHSHPHVKHEDNESGID